MNLGIVGCGAMGTIVRDMALHHGTPSPRGEGIVSAFCANQTNHKNQFCWFGFPFEEKLRHGR